MLEYFSVLKAVETVGTKYIKGSENYENAVREELKKTSFKSFVMVSTFLICHNVPSAPDKKGVWDTLGKISHSLHQNIFCDPSLEPSHQDSSNEGSQCMFLWRNEKNHLLIILNTTSYQKRYFLFFC